MSEKEVKAVARGGRKVRRGVVASNKMDKSVVVRLDRAYQHPLYGKTVRRSNRVTAHDEHSCDIGDTVEIMETRPLSKTKHWRVVRIIEKVK
ncbi:MAG: 30S ribosomal protein S17 [Fimbriimonadaceae bacterium]